MDWIAIKKYFMDIYNSIELSGSSFLDIPADIKSVKIVYNNGDNFLVVDKKDIEVNDYFVDVNVYGDDDYKKISIPLHNIEFVEWRYE